MRRHNESMRTTIDLDERALKLAKAAAHRRKVSLGRVCSEALLQIYAPEPAREAVITIDSSGFPTVDIGRPITYEEVNAFLEENPD